MSNESNNGHCFGSVPARGHSNIDSIMDKKTDTIMVLNICPNYIKKDLALFFA